MPDDDVKGLFLIMRVCTSLVLLFLCQFSAAQVFNDLSTFTTRNGLSNNYVSSLEKDEEGFLWIGTHEGLNQYDGTEFVNILSNSKNNLPSNSIIKICYINRYTLAIATGGGLCFLNTKTLEGKRIAPGNEVSSPKNYVALDILFDEKARELWVATIGGLYVLSEEGILKRKMEANKEAPLNGAFAAYLFKDPFDHVFILSQKRNGFYYPDFEKETLLPVEKRLPDFPLNKFFGNNYLLRGANFINHKIICCFSRGDYKNKMGIIAFYDNEKRTAVIDSFSTSFTNQFYFFDAYSINDSMLLVNSYFGEPLLFNINTHTIKPAADHPLWFTSWPDGIGVKLLADKENIWAGSTTGLIHVPLHPDIFKTNQSLVAHINSKNSLISYNNGIYYNRKLWVSSVGTGLFSLDTVTNKIQSVFDKHTPAKFKRKIISNDLEVVGHSIWLFSVYGPVQVDPVTLKLSNVEAQNKDSLFDDNGGFPFKDLKGNTWITVPMGMTKYIAATNSFITYKNKLQGGTFPLARAHYKTEDGKGNMWFGRRDTLVKFDTGTQTYSIYFLKKNGFALSSMEALASDGKDLLFMALNRSFAIYHISTDSLELYTKETGIVSTSINDIIIDKRGNPWMATEGGLVYYNRIARSFYSYTRADGLPDDNIISLNFTDDSKSSVFLGFPRSYCIFNIESLLAKRNATIKNTITGVQVNGQAIEFYTPKTFSYKENNISFFYTGINFTAGQQNSYAYMLQGFDNNWKYGEKKRQCNYINLQPGKYTFKIKSANQQGEWNEMPATFSFTISAPYWQTWWFRILLAISATLLIYWFIKRRDRIKEKENKAALQMSELKLTALQSQMNPHFIFNSLNSIQNYIMQQKPVDAARYLSKFSKLMRRVLDQSFNNLVPLNEIAETLRMYLELEAFRFSNEFEYEIQQDDRGSINDVKLPPLLLQPYVENAIIHGLMPKEGNKKLLIRLFKQNNELHCVIDDNGIGRGNQLSQNEHISRGQKLTSDMLNAMKQLLHTDATIHILDKMDVNNHPAGTTVELIIPLNSNN